MKLLFVLALCIAAVAARGYTHGHNGRPGCQTDEEMTRIKWRNNFDPTRYWECRTRGEAGVEVVCWSEYLYQPGKDECVPYLEWVWTPLEDPPTLG